MYKRQLVPCGNSERYYRDLGNQRDRDLIIVPVEIQRDTIEIWKFRGLDLILVPVGIQRDTIEIWGFRGTET